MIASCGPAAPIVPCVTISARSCHGRAGVLWAMDASVRDGQCYEFGPFSLDPIRRELRREGDIIALSPNLFDTLLYLVEHPGRVVSKDELMDAIWPSKVVEESNISQTIFTLRRALTGAGAREALIATQPGQGYRFTDPVQVGPRRAEAEAGAVPVGAPATGLAPPSTGLADAQPGRRARRAWIIGAAVLIVVGAAAGIWRWRTPPAAPVRNIVVLGQFQNLARDPQFDGAFAIATQIDLLQSPYVSVLPEQKVEDTLALMTRPREAPLTPAIAREVCARNNGAATIDGAVAQVGGRYLLTLTASDCMAGDVLAAEKAEVVRRADLLPTLDRLVGRIRGRLGESAASIQRFGAPLLQRKTASLEALQAYSQAVYDVGHGKRVDAIPLFQHAISIDPKFAAAYSDLSAIYYNLHQTDLARASISQAYALKDDVGERERFFILARYNTEVTGDIPEGLRIYRSWTQLYPNDAAAWSNLANKESWVAHYAQAIDDARQALALGPDSETSYVVLARALLHAGRLDEAQAICLQAVARKVDGDDLHGVLYQIAVARDDDAGAQRQLAWAQGKPGERSMLIEAGQVAYARGQVRQGQALFAQALEDGRPFGLGDIFSGPNSRLLYDLGREDLARQSLAKVPAGFDSGDYRYSLAAFGDAARAKAVLAADIARTPSDTLLTQVYAAEQHAAEALRRGQPSAAIAALESARPYEMRTFDIPYVRGLAYLAASDGARAAVEFHKILDHRGVEAVSEHYQLAHLGLARALRLQHDTPGARKAYEQVFADWRGADPDMPLLIAARSEYAALRP